MAIRRIVVAAGQNGGKGKGSTSSTTFPALIVAPSEFDSFPELPPFGLLFLLRFLRDNLHGFAYNFMLHNRFGAWS